MNDGLKKYCCHINKISVLSFDTIDKIIYAIFMVHSDIAFEVWVSISSLSQSSIPEVDFLTCKLVFFINF